MSWLTRSCIASATSRSCAARRIRASWSHERRSSGLFGARADGRMLDGRRRASARRREGAAAETDRRRGVPHARRSARRAARADANRLCRNLRVDHSRAPRGRQGRISADARRFPVGAGALSRTVGASGRTARRHGWMAARAVFRTLLDCSRAASGRRRCATPCASAATRRCTWLAAGGSRRRAHAFARTARAAGYAHRDPPSLHAGCSGPSSVSERRAASALLRAAAEDLSAGAAR